MRKRALILVLLCASALSWAGDAGAAAPAPPAQVRGVKSASGNSFSVSWDSPTTRVDGSAIGPGELGSYRIVKLASLNGATSQILIQNATATLTFTDSSLQNSIFYYKLRAINVSGEESRDSDVVAVAAAAGGKGDIYVMLDDGVSNLRIPGDLAASLSARGLRVGGNRRPAEEAGAVFKSVRLYISDSSGRPATQALEQPVDLNVGYRVDSSGLISNGAPSARALPLASAAGEALSIYWHNGAEWIKLGTSVDTQNNRATVRTRQAGSFQVRLVNQADVQKNSVFPRTITPNNDGINDRVFFFFENRSQAEIQGTVYDLESARVADLSVTDIFSSGNSVLAWDGRDAGGSVVPGGVYVYKIEVGAATFTGTVGVAR